MMQAGSSPPPPPPPPPYDPWAGRLIDLVGPHFTFRLAQGLVETVYDEHKRIYYASIPDLEMLAIGDPGEPESDVVAALGGALCELWCEWTNGPDPDVPNLAALGPRLARLARSVKPTAPGARAGATNPAGRAHRAGRPPDQMTALLAKLGSPTLRRGIF